MKLGLLAVDKHYKSKLMESFLVFGVCALLSLGLISLGEMIVRSLRSRSSEPLNRDPLIEAAGSGLSGMEPGDSSHFFGSIGNHILHFLQHFLHH